RVFLAELFGDLQESLSQALLAINRDEVGDDLLLVRNPNGQILDEAFEKIVRSQPAEKLPARNLFQERVFHCGRGFEPGPKPGQAQLAENIPSAVDRKHAF